jgi:hypothetical protein
MGLDSRLTASFGIARNPDYLSAGDADPRPLSVGVSRQTAIAAAETRNCCAHCARPIHNRSRHAAPNAKCEH